MHAQCSCGTGDGSFTQALGCIDCGSACCPECAISLESATYCQSCAAALLNTATVRAGSTFELH